MLNGKEALSKRPSFSCIKMNVIHSIKKRKNYFLNQLNDKALEHCGRG